MKKIAVMVLLVVLALFRSSIDTRADAPIRFGKAVPYPFAYAAADVAQAIGAFKKRGLEVELSSFTGAAKMQQALTSGSIDFGVSGGSDMAFGAKGAPVLAIAATYIGMPLAVLVTKDSPLQKADDLKGKTLAVAGTGGVTEWMPLELSRQKGWGKDAIKIIAVGTSAAQLEAIKTKQLDGIVTDVTTGYRFEAMGEARVMLRFNDYVNDFILGAIFGRKDFLKIEPDKTRRFMLAWFDTIEFMRSHREETIKIVQPVMDVSPDIAARSYDELMNGYSTTGRFSQAGLKVLARTWIDMGTLSAEPKMSDLYTEDYLPSTAR